MNTLVELPEEDSPDLTDEEIAGAVEASTSARMAEVFAETKCPTCSDQVMVSRHQLRKRGPLHYARLFFVCKDGHAGSITFRASFLGGT